EARHFDAYSDETASFVRENARAGNKHFIVFETGYGLKDSAPHIVSDHLNLTGDNPLVGQNDNIGPRFPVINDVYSNSPAADRALGKAVAAGLAQGYRPGSEDIDKITELGGDFYCYNLIPLAIVAAHAGCTVSAVALPEGKTPDKELVDLLRGN
ncbi:MAG: hypothetical protein K8F91_10080, partial [Candidatus Obscuribacterales bacterium]|nr:hypothetical protein [Candidatus Obscuribacterales bacterium]